ncbi:hypothetical protein SAMN05216413_2531 [Ruminococcaceae bacterium KH2T8]|nr:hypothetical protein SAMN05216413_2531 [Ruminococcaceae bacterium KH2T8]
MIRENNIVIDPNKSSEFVSFLKKIGKTEQFWKENKNVARTKVDEAELDRLFEGDDL